MDAFIKLAGTVVGFVILVVVLGLILALPVMWLWNGCLIPAVSGLHEITWFQAWGIMILFSILFKDTASGNS